MKKIILLIVLMGSSVFSWSQLQIDSIMASKAYCRTYDFQNGNGSLSAFISGGVAPYLYLWENMQTGFTSTNQVFAGLNPGTYSLNVTDANNVVVTSTVVLDSINPIASFDVVSSLNSGNVSFENTSINVYDTNIPLSEPLFEWNLNSSNQNNWFFAFDDLPVDTVYTSGNYQVCLIAINYNDCRDTVCASIDVFNPADIEDNELNQFYSIHPSVKSRRLLFNKVGFDNGVELKVYSISGKLILKKEIFEDAYEIEFDPHRGTYVYELIGIENNVKLGKGKFIF